MSLLKRIRAWREARRQEAIVIREWHEQQTAETLAREAQPANLSIAEVRRIARDEIAHDRALRHVG